MNMLNEKLPQKFASIIIGALTVVSFIILFYPLLFLFAPVSALKIVLYPLWSMIDTLTTMIIGMTAFDPWIARAIAIALYSSVSFVFVGAIGNMVGVHKYLFKKEHRVVVVISGCAICMGMYFISKGINFSPITGEPLKKYSRQTDGQIKLFPIEMDFDSDLGDTLKLVTREVILLTKTPAPVKSAVQKSVTSQPKPTLVVQPEPKPVPNPLEVVPKKESPVKVSSRSLQPPAPKKIEPPPPPLILAAGDHFEYEEKRVKIKDILLAPHIITLRSISLDERLRVRVTYEVENQGKETSALELLQPETYAYVVDQRGVKHPFRDAENFPKQLPSGIPVQFSLFFEAVPNTTNRVSIVFRFGYYMGMAPTSWGQDVVFNKLELK